MPFEFLFHGKRAVVTDLQKRYEEERDKLHRLILDNAPTSLIERQERKTNRLYFTLMR